MERSHIYSQKKLSFTYEDYINREKTLQNLKIDRYVIYEKIGQGSNGEVYKGMDDITKRTVAVKLMNLRQINALQKITVKLIKQRLCESQPRLMQQCNSQNLIKCIEIYRNQDLKILILEYCNGQTLQQQINQKGRISQKQAIYITKHIINGLMELHRNKIIHRDLKAENIMSHNGTYKIIDFGFSKKLQIAQENAQVRGTSLGTITTMAPEVMSQRPYGLKADIWSLGVIFFQMIYGVYPYDSLNAYSLYREIKQKKLFSKSDPPIINGFKPTMQSYEFIKFLIVFDTEQRPSWKQVSEHKLIRSQSQQMNQRFIKKVDVAVDKQFSQVCLQNSFQGASQFSKSKGLQQFINEKRPVKKEQMKRQYANQQININQEQKLIYDRNTQADKIKYLQKTIMTVKKGEAKRQQKNQQVYEVHQVKQEQILRKRQEQNMDQNQQYNFTQRAHLQCLKTQFIFRQIINPILLTNYLNFIYLLLARCFNNMSPIQNELEQRQKNKQIIHNLVDQITPLYKQVRQKFQEYALKLTEKENKWYSIVGDFFNKKIDKVNFQEKDRFLTGIEVANYTKEQQIQFIQKFYSLQVRKKIEGINNLANVFRKLNKFTEINTISQQYLTKQRKTFIQMVKEITS